MTHLPNRDCARSRGKAAWFRAGFPADASATFAEIKKRLAEIPGDDTDALDRVRGFRKDMADTLATARKALVDDAPKDAAKLHGYAVDLSKGIDALATILNGVAAQTHPAALAEASLSRWADLGQTLMAQAAKARA